MSGSVPDGAVGGSVGGIASLRIRLFGSMDVLVGDAPLPRLRSRRGAWLLALLAMRGGRVVDRKWLAGTLWPDSEETDALRSLRQALHDLREALGSEAWRISNTGFRDLRLDLSAAHVDVLDFDAAVMRGDARSLETAVALRRGPLLEECAEEWALEERRHREQTYLSALEKLASEAEGRGDPASSASFLRKAVAAEPYREDLQRSLMQALDRNGDPVGALRAYRAYRALLSREMASEPGHEITALFRNIRDELRKQPGQSDVRLPRPVGPLSGTESPCPGGVPVPLTGLIGRDEAVQEVRCLLARARLVTLIGAGGIGKTRMAIEVAGEMDSEFEDGVCFVSLAALSDPQHVPDAVLKSLGAAADGQKEPMETLQRWLATRRLLLVLDNCEHLRSACSSLAAMLLGQSRGLRMLATSRHPLGLMGETIWRVPPLSLPPTGAADQPASSSTSALESYSAIRLFVERARAAEPSFHLTASNADSVGEVCRKLDGIPLAIELAAARVRSLPVEQIGSRLARGLTLLSGRGFASESRHQTLEAAIRWSWDLLEPEEQALLRRLSVFSGGCTLEAAEAVGAGWTDDVGPLTDAHRRPDPSSISRPPSPVVAPSEVLEILTSLVDHSLVVYAPGEEPRYCLLETIRQFAANQLEQTGEWEELHNRHRDFFLEWAVALKPKMSGRDQALSFRRAEVDHANLRAAVQWSRSRAEDVEKEVRLVLALSRFWNTCGHLQEERANLEAILNRTTRPIPADLRSWLLGQAGWNAYVRGDYATARTHYTQLLAIRRASGDIRGAADALNMLGIVEMDDGRLEASRAALEESLALHKEYGIQEGLRSLYDNVGCLELLDRNYAHARRYLEQSATLCEAEEATQLQGIVQHDLSVLDLREGRPADAKARCAAALRIMRECAAIVNVPTALDQMALVARAEAQWERAAVLLGAADALRAMIGAQPSGLTAADRAAACREAAAALGAEAFSAATAEGKLMDAEKAVAWALQDLPF